MNARSTTRKRPVNQRWASALVLALLPLVGATAFADPPLNDYFSQAFVLSGASGAVTGTNVEATREAKEPDHAGFDEGASVWWRWVAPADGVFTFNTFGSDFDTLLAAYSGVWGNLQEMDANDDANGGHQSRITFLASAGTVYYIAVDGYDGAQGAIELSWRIITAPPANDAFASAVAITGAEGQVAGHNFLATTEAGEPDDHLQGVVGIAGAGASVWYVWTAPAASATSSTTLFTLTGDDMDWRENGAQFAIYQGDSLGELNSVATAYTWPDVARAAIAVEPGQRYYIAIDTRADNHKQFKLSWQSYAPPANDDFADALEISGAEGSLDGDNTGASKEPGEPLYHLAMGGTVWYRWTAPAGAQTTMFTLTGPEIQEGRASALFAVYEGAALEELDVVANAWTDADTFTAASAFQPTPGQTYFIGVDTYSNGGYQPFTLAWSIPEPVANDNFADAAEIAGTSGTVIASNFGATKQAQEPNHAGVAGGASVWWRWTAPEDGAIRFDTFGSAIDTVLAAYTGPASNLQEVASNDDSGEVYQSRIVFEVTEGTIYHIAVDGYGGVQGAITLSWQAMTPLANDNFADALEISGASGSVTGSNYGATKEPQEPEHAGVDGGASVWWHWTAEIDGPVVFDTFGSDFDTVLAAYTGEWGNLLQVAANDDADERYQSRMAFVAEAETTYYIAVDGWEGQEGDIVLSWTTQAPVNNDNFADAIDISEPEGSVTGANYGATKEPQEPEHAGVNGGASVWWRWTAPANAPVTFNTFGSDFDTLLAAYTGSLGALQAMDANDDAGEGYQSRIAFIAQAGITYHIAVDGYGGRQGNIVLNWSSTVMADTDGDGKPDVCEYVHPGLPETKRTNIFLPDSDGDGLLDGQEDPGDCMWIDAAPLAMTNPRNPDTDGDGFGDGVETLLLDTDPLDPNDPAADDPDFIDTNGDGLPDAFKLSLSLDPEKVDTDGDGFSDAYELLMGSDPLDVDSVPFLGDVNGDGAVNNTDAVLLHQMLLGHVDPNQLIMANADVHPNGIIQNIDALVLNYWSLGLVDVLPFRYAD